MIENQPNELTLIYHSDKGDDKKARAFIESVTEYKVKTLDLKKDSITETQLAEIADKMGVKIEMLFDHTYKDRFQAQKPLNANAVTDSDLLAILSHEQVLIKTPIVIIGKKAYQYDSANEIINKIMITGVKDGAAKVSKV
jgi:arsenate reductase-like glutaredoxin family protein